MAGRRDLAGCESLPGLRELSRQDLAGNPAFGLLSSDHWLERLLDNLVFVSSCPPAGLAAGMATTVRAQVWGTKKTQTLVHRQEPPGLGHTRV